MKIHKGDNVKMLSGKDRGKTGKVMVALPDEGRIRVEGLNIAKKHLRPKKAGEKGQIASIPALVSVAKVSLMCPKCGKATRVGYAMTDTKKQRICKKCNSEV
ncbi:MAG: 50S ribosomal protein L24 [bacterium]|nr:50S ribosomal protein L24 [bacterium]